MPDESLTTVDTTEPGKSIDQSVAASTGPAAEVDVPAIRRAYQHPHPDTFGSARERHGAMIARASRRGIFSGAG